jgi:hypothetical protein
MAVCPNCNAQINCGCQYRDTSDGKKVCNNCIEAYERQLQQNQLSAEQAASTLNTYLNS